MLINAQCQCGTRYELPEKVAGQPVRCNICGNVFTCPFDNEDLPYVPVVASPPPNMKPSAAPGNPQPWTPHQQPAHYHPPKDHQSTYQQPTHQQPAQLPSGPSGRRQRAGAGRAALSGCLVPLFIMLGILGALGLASYVAFLNVKRTVTDSLAQVGGMVEMMDSMTDLADPTELIEHYKAEGYEHHMAQVDLESETINNKRIYTCQMLELKSDVNDDLAILSQVAVLHGEIKGDVDFLGQLIELKPGCVIHGDLNLKFAQGVTVDGKIKGKLRGGYQVITGQNNVEGGIEASEKLKDLITGLGKRSRKITGDEKVVRHRESRSAINDRIEERGIPSEKENRIGSERPEEVNDWYGSADWLNIVIAQNKIGKCQDLLDYFEAEGFTRISSQAISIEREIDSKHLCCGQSVEVSADSKFDIAICSQSASVSGEIFGDLYFGGQRLHIENGAVIHGDLHLMGAQAVKLDGVIEGNVTGRKARIRGKGDLKGKLIEESFVEGELAKRDK